MTSGLRTVTEVRDATGEDLYKQIQGIRDVYAAAFATPPSDKDLGAQVVDQPLTDLGRQYRQHRSTSGNVHHE